MKALAVFAAAAFLTGPQPVRQADSSPSFRGHGTWISYSGGQMDLSGHALKEPIYTSPSGRYLVHYLEQPPYTVTVLRADGTQPNVLPDAFSGPSWSADESELVFDQRRGLALADGDGSNVRPIPLVTGCEDGSCFANLGAPELSPDGRSVAVVVTTVPAQGGPYRNVPGAVSIVPVTGGALRTAGAMAVCEPDADLQWSSDSQWLAYLESDCDSYGNILHVLRAADGKATRFHAQLGNDGDYAWAAVGALFAYQTKHAVGLAGPNGQLRALRGARSPSWAPTGTRLAVGRAGRIEVLNAPNGAPHAVARGESPSWSPAGDWIAYGVPQCGPRQGIHLVHPDGTGDHRLVHVCGIDPNGARTVTGTPFDDEIDAEDELRQTISCGRGHDVVYADRKDTVARDCESIIRK